MTDWKNFDYPAIRREAMALYDEFNRTAVRISAVMPQDALEYWIAVAAWQRAQEPKK